MIKGVEEEYDRLFRHAADKGLLEHLEGSKSGERIAHKTNSADQSRLNTSCGTLKVAFVVHFQRLNNHRSQVFHIKHVLPSSHPSSNI